MFQNIRERDDGLIADIYFGDIRTAIKEAIKIATEHDLKLTFQFNSVDVVVCKDSNEDLTYRDWERALKGYIEKMVGPYPKEVLSDDEKNNDLIVKAEADAKEKKIREEYERKEKEKRNILNKTLEKCPQLTVDTDKWEKLVSSNIDPYGTAIIQYAEYWAG